MKQEGLSYGAEVRLPFKYGGVTLGHAYVMDFVVAELVVVEIKAVSRMLPVHRAQLVSYLKLSGHPAGLLINFNVTSLINGIIRVLNDRPPAKRPLESS